ncbi:hypothetical protein HNQ77_000632 [Silvibacterium bohemicum]|uniref:Nuclease n=1 Tax=Silvibacterium bohemicum TaxID=1577686 RepID=A0A841JXI0_9BACT|nr:nuclease [Silvibacterium bohemicum]MBB6142694.1 hypothetical protein [Silvibacterium bohemicum]
MTRQNRFFTLLHSCTALVLVSVLLTQHAFAWGVDGHHMVNRLAGMNLPNDVPLFLRSPEGLNALEYYAPEPDHWRGRGEPQLADESAPDHFIALERVALLGSLPRNRYDYVRALVPLQTTHPDLPLTVERMGTQPYQTVEMSERLKSAMRDYRALLADKRDTKPLEAEIIFLAGILGHYVGDGSMPLHTSIYPNGWSGPNPNGYTTEHHIHALFESVFVGANVKIGDLEPAVKASEPKLLGDVFDDYVAYLRHSNTLVEKTYQLEKAGAFSGAGTPDGKAFAEERLAAGAIELRDIIYTAWIRSADPVAAH